MMLLITKMTPSSPEIRGSTVYRTLPGIGRSRTHNPCGLLTLTLCHLGTYSSVLVALPVPKGHFFGH